MVQRNNRVLVKTPKSKIKKSTYFLYLILFGIIYYAASVISEYEALDLAHYINDSQDLMRYSIPEIIAMRFGFGKYDFIYHALLVFAIKHSVIILMTSVTVFIYFMLVLRQMHRMYEGHIEIIVIVAILFLAPITWTCAMSRNLMAFMFLYCAIVSFYNDKKMLAFLFAVVSVFTHFTVIMYIAVITAAYFLRNKTINPGFLLLIFFVMLIISITVPSTAYDIIRKVLSEDSGFYHYTDKEIASLWSALSYGDWMPGVSSLIYSVVLLVLNKKQGVEFWMLFMLVSMDIFFITMSTNFVLRLTIFLPMFWGLNIAKIYEEGNIQSRQAVLFASLAAMLPIMLHFYSYRPQYFAFL